jgi:flagellar protein FlaJ
MIEMIILFGSIFLILFYIYYNYKKKKEVVEYFPKFSQEIHNHTASGMSLVDAVRKSRDSYYGRLTPLIRNMCHQIEWGIPFYLALKKFADKINNPFIDKVATLTERAAEFSPDIGKSIKEINDYILLTKELEKERYLELFPQVISVYFVFCIFLFIVYILFNFFIPSFELTNIDFYESVFKHMVIIESLIASFVLGKISENSFVAGIKHLIVLLSISFIFLFIV